MWFERNGECFWILYRFPFPNQFQHTSTHDKKIIIVPITRSKRIAVRIKSLHTVTIEIWFDMNGCRIETENKRPKTKTTPLKAYQIWIYLVTFSPLFCLNEFDLSVLFYMAYDIAIFSVIVLFHFHWHTLLIYAAFGDSSLWVWHIFFACHL